MRPFEPLETASGYVLGEDRDAPPLPHETRSVRACLEEAVARALARPPCVVAFSGGRDSSAVLALATAVARRRGLDLPVPLTFRFPHAPETAEDAWQERVVSHLGLDEWERIELHDELDALGPVATAALRRHGLYWPANAHFLVPALRAARGGSLLTGAGGDQLLDPGRHARLARVLARRTPPEPRDLLRVAVAASPVRVRTAVRARRDPPRLVCPWLRPAAEAAVRAALARDAATEPVRRGPWARWVWRARPTQAGLRIMSLLAEDEDATLVHPFFEPAVFAAFGAETRRDPPASRTVAMRRLVGDLLPADVCERRSKAVFTTPFWNVHAAAYAATLSPEDVDSDLVDGDGAVRIWSQPESSEVPLFRSLTLLQATWLRNVSVERVKERVRGGDADAPVPRAS
ncbi:MAG TPA: asparagine synthase-related protein [Gaiellaceae bacterium]|nr:asparagine synthase-related protein [Gaiellaceae bacterium]